MCDSKVASPRTMVRVVVSLVLGSIALATLAPASASQAAGPAPRARWVQFRHVAAVVDLAGPLSDGTFIVAAAGKLSLLDRNGLLTPYARGVSGYSTALGPEPYITFAAAETNGQRNCSFSRDAIFAIEPSKRPGVIKIDAHGRARRFANLPVSVQPNGIAFDMVGRFGHRLLVTAGSDGGTIVFAIGCSGKVTTIAKHDPSVEGGIAVAPASFGQFAGDLIAPNEGSGRVFAIAPTGRAVTLVQSNLPSGGDIGVESAGFVPIGFGPRDAAYLADRFSPGNPHPGTDSILQLPGSVLIQAGVRPGDLLVASEGGARTIAVRCQSVCTVRHIANGPAVAHAEGHIRFS
jgi:hypothetical protein